MSKGVKVVVCCLFLVLIVALSTGHTIEKTTITGTIQAKQYTPAYHGSGLENDENEPERWQVSIMIDDGSYVIDDKELYQNCKVEDTIEVVKTKWKGSKGNVISTSVSLPNK